MGLRQSLYSPHLRRLSQILELLCSEESVLFRIWSVTDPGEKSEHKL